MTKSDHPVKKAALHAGVSGDLGDHGGQVGPSEDVLHAPEVHEGETGRAGIRQVR